MVNRLEHSSLPIYDLPVLIEKMKHSHTWLNGGLNSMIILNSPCKKIVLAALHEETEIKSFQSNNSITFQVIEGKLRFHTREESVTIDKGQLMTLHENTEYRLRTKEETVLLLTIVNRILQPSEF